MSGSIFHTECPQLLGIAKGNLVAWATRCLAFVHPSCKTYINPLNPELNPICYLLALLGAHHFLHVSRIRVKLLTFR